MTENAAMDSAALDQLFRTARTQNKWQDRPIADARLEELYDTLKHGPTSANCSPARFVFVRTAEGKAKLKEALSDGNIEKAMTAPVTVIVGHDPKFYDLLPKLFPHADARSWFVSSEALAQATAFRNGTLQGAYLMLAARAMGIDSGAMSGFNNDRIDELFFADTGWQSNFLVNLGYGDAAGVLGKLPRLSFDEACRFA